MAKKISTENETSSSVEPKVVSKTPKRQHNLKFEAIPEKEYEVVAYDDPAVVAECEKMYPETTLEFKRILFTQYELFCKKQLNYGPANISVGTNLETDEDVKLSLTGLWFRLNDKVQRYKTMVLGNQTDKVGESLEDTFQDLSVYGIIAQIVSAKKWGK